MYEYYESQRIKTKTKTKKPNRPNRMTTAIFTSQTIKKGRPLHRKKQRKPKPPIREASELEDLLNDQYFYDQLEKNKPTMESSADVEQIPNDPQVNRDIIFYHSPHFPKGKQHKGDVTQYYGVKLNNDDVQTDTYDDYGEMAEMPDKDVEMHDAADNSTEKPYRPIPIIIYDGTSIGKPLNGYPRPNIHHPRPNIHHPRPNIQHPRPRPKCKGKKNPKHLNHTIKFSKPLFVANLNNSPKSNEYEHKTSYKKRYENIQVTKQLSSPEELHAEIDKIFNAKYRNYDKRGHGKSHWELRIFPLPQDDYESERWLKQQNDEDYKEPQHQEEGQPEELGNQPKQHMADEEEPHDDQIEKKLLFNYENKFI